MISLLLIEPSFLWRTCEHHKIVYDLIINSFKKNKKNCISFFCFFVFLKLNSSIPPSSIYLTLASHNRKLTFILHNRSDAFARLYDRRMLPPPSSSRQLGRPPSCVSYFCPAHLSEHVYFYYPQSYKNSYIAFNFENFVLKMICYYCLPTFYL